MTLPEAEMLSRYWQKAPPIHLLARAAVGFKPPPDLTAQAGQFKESTAEEILGFFSDFDARK